MSGTPTELMRRIYRAMEQRKGMMFSAQDLDMVAEMGGLEAMSNFTADVVRREAEERQSTAKAERQATMDADWKKLHPRPFSDTEAERALRRAWELCRPKSKRP